MSRSLFDLTPESLGAFLTTWKEPAYRATQILEWIYEHGVSGYEHMTNLPKALRARLLAELPIYQSTIKRRQESRDGTVKLLLGWPAGDASECVLIPDGQRRTACISTQVGCPVRCVFCASGLGGLERNLSAGQIVEQAMRVRELCDESARLSNVVFMGLGEPLANYDATVEAVRTINAEWGMGIGAAQDHRQHGGVAQADAPPGRRKHANYAGVVLARADRRASQEADPVGGKCQSKVAY